MKSQDKVILKNMFNIYKQTLEKIEKNLDSNFDNCVDLIFNNKENIVISGIGKSGLVGKKIAATLTSTGTPGTSGAKTTIENSTTYSNLLADSNNYFIDAYDLIRSWSHTNLFINENNGNASFSILGTPSGGNTLSIKEISADPDGTGSLSYNWELSNDGNSWSSVSTTSEYLVTASDEGKHIRVSLSYTDGEGFSESLYAKGFYQSFLC